ncbi:MAG: hypothetical protein O7E52_29745 [Candidatus Poribacteria bacterium]|nr:hypothetical protein [Candidatus Poribacteria bacterium]
MHYDLPQIIEQIAVHLRVAPDQIELAPIRHGTLERNNVWRLTAMGQSYLLKQHLIPRPIGAAAFTPFQVESSVLSTLHPDNPDLPEAGYYVPRIYWQSESALCLLLEWCGDTTLDALAQDTSTEALKPITQNAVRAFCQLEDRFAKCAGDLMPYIYPLDYPEFLRRTLQSLLDRGRKTMDYLAWMTGGPMRASQAATIDQTWERVSDRLHRAPPTLGCLDYNARNVVVDGDTPTFIDFASIGWDWGERRLVQSLNSLGAHRLGGNFVTLLDRGVVGEYARQVVSRRAGCSETEIAAQGDYHHLLFYLSIVYRLMQATAQPEDDESKSLLKAWGDAKPRFQRALNLLADANLSDDADATQIREFIAEFRDASGENGS